MEKIKKFLEVCVSEGAGWSYGYGKGTGSSSGSIWGYGSGWSSGSGSGFSWGHESSYGYGYGSGKDTGYTSINGKAVHYIDDIPTIITAVKGNVAKGFILETNLTLTPCFVIKQDNLFSHGQTLADAQKSLIDKILIDSPVEDRIAKFKQEFKRNIKYKARKFFEWHYRLTGSCEMGRLRFVKDHDIDLDNDMFTVKEFVDLTKHTHGGEIIRQLYEDTNE